MIATSKFASRILVIDDDPIVTSTVHLCLTKAGYRFTKALNDATLAFEVIHKWKPQVLLLDLSMPSIDGMEILDRLSDLIVENEITVIVLTSMSDTAAKRKALLLGAHDFICKPFEPNRLTSQVANAIEGKPNVEFVLNSLPPKSSR